MPSPPSSRRRLRVIRQLRAAHDSLCAWDSSLRQAVSVPGGLAPTEASALLAVFDNARRDLTRRLSELGEAAAPAAPLVPQQPAKRPARSATEGAALSAACRACGRALGAAFREAQAVADAATAGIVYGPLRALEKQLWYLDPLQHS